MRKTALSLCGLALIALPVEQARAQLTPGGVFVCANCADEPTSLAMKATQILQYIEEATIALNAIQIAQQEIREGVNLVTHPSTNIAADLGQLTLILSQSQGLAGGLAQIDSTFRSIYAPYTVDPIITYADAYSTWAATTWNTIHATANVAGMQSDMLASEQDFIAQIQTLNSTDVGRDQALQIGNAIGTEEVSQLQKLRQLMLADMSSKQAYLAQQVNAQQSVQSAQQGGFVDANWTSDTRSW